MNSLGVFMRLPPLRTTYMTASNRPNIEPLAGVLPGQAHVPMLTHQLVSNVGQLRNKYHDQIVYIEQIVAS